MIFSALRSQGKASSLRSRSPIVIIDSNDDVFAEKIAKILDQWGIRHLHLWVDSEFELPEDEGGVVLLDIRELIDDAFDQVYYARQQYAGIEVILINKPDNVTASIAGMKAGAVDEIIVPFDTDALKTIISEAFERGQATRAKKIKKSLSTRFSETMMAATFAQAGDFEGALDLLDSPVPRQTDNPVSNGNKSES